MTKIDINTPASDFSLDDFSGNPFTLSDLHGRKRVLLVFNRTFA